MSDLLYVFSGAALLLAAAFTPKTARQKIFSVFQAAPPSEEETTNTILNAALAGAGVGTSVPIPQTKPQRLEGLDTMARTIWGEARGQGYAGMQAVASVIMNRYYAAQKNEAKARQYGRTIEQICKKPYQFSVWNANDANRAKIMAVGESDSEFRRAVAIADKALQGNLPDNTGGADHYLNVPVTKQINNGRLPSWVNLNFKTASIGDHTFLKLG